MTERVCLDCGVDISGRGKSSTCCEKHAVDRHLTYILKYNQTHRKQRRELNRKWKAENPEKARDCARKHSANNREKIRARNREWASENPERVRESMHRSRSRKSGKLGMVSKGIILRLLTSQKHRCAACGTDIRSPQPYDLDHIIPFCRGGIHEDSNLQCLCPPCNRAKGRKLPAEWACSTHD